MTSLAGSLADGMLADVILILHPTDTVHVVRDSRKKYGH